MEKIYPRTHVMIIMGLNFLSFLVGVGLAAGPFVKNFYLGGYDTTVHVGVGMLIATLAFFRLALAYGAIWIDIVLAAFGVITFMLPTFMHMRWNTHYNLAHQVGGAVVLIVAIVSLVLTLPALGKAQYTHA